MCCGFGGRGSARLSLQRSREFEFLGCPTMGCPTERVSENLPPVLPWAALQSYLNQGMGQQKSPRLRSRIPQKPEEFKGIRENQEGIQDFSLGLLII